MSNPLPYNYEAEQASLGAILLDREIVPVVGDILSPGDFYMQGNGVIFETCLQLYSQNAPVDLVSVVDALRKQGRLEKVGGVSYIAGLSNMIPTAEGAAYYAEIVASHATVRRVIQKAEEIAAKGYEGLFTNAADYAAMAEESMISTTMQARKSGLVRVGDVLYQRLKEIEARRELKGITGIETGFRMLDLWTSGFQPGELIIVAGRPSMGKTSWGVQVAAHAAVRNDKKVAVFSLETSRDMLIEKLLINRGQVSGQKVRTGKFSPEEHAQLASAARALAKAGLYIDDSASLSVAELRAKCRRMQAERGLDMVVIDYLTLLRPTKNRESRRLEVADISAGLRIMAKELNIPVVALSQLSRKVEDRRGQKPIMSDLREAGEIEQDAHVIIFIHRPEKYDPSPENEGKAFIILEKQRNGPTGEFEVYFEKSYTRFGDMERRELTK